MKITIPEISWHNRDPLLSLDIQPNQQDGFYRLATAGTDTHVVIWQLRPLDNGGISVEVLSDLVRHNRAVNVVRFSPDGDYLASADDEAAVILWKKEESTDMFMDESEKENKEHWTIWKMLRGHLEDVYDLCWSPCSQYLLTGAVDNTAILWDVSKGKSFSILSDHKGFVQGVAWDPLGQYVATLCSDRCFRIYSIATKKIAFKIYKAALPLPGEDGVTIDKTTKLFYDDTLKSFCRRLSFSPDGELLLTPSGIIEEENGKITNVTYVFSRQNPAKPVMYLSTKDKYTLAVRFCPVLFELNHIPWEEGSSPETSEPRESWQEHFNLLHVPYRMIFAVATQNAVLLYDTQQGTPFSKLSNIHYTRLSDLSWSSDGRVLVISSTDGYCSLVSFAEGELGTPYVEGNCKKDNFVETDSTETEECANIYEEEMEQESITVSSKKPVDITTPDKEDKNVEGEKLPSHTQDMVSKGEETKESEKENSSTEDASVEQKDQSEKEPSSNTKNTPVQKQLMESSETCDTSEEPQKKQISVRKAGDSSKSTKRIALITLSGPSHKSNENTPLSKAEPLPATSTSETQKLPDVDEEVKKMFEGESVTPSKASKAASPSKTPTGKTPRRVPLITLSSPKGKKSNNECR